MKKIIPFLTIALMHQPLFSAGGGEDKVSLNDDGKKSNVAFYGTLETQAGKTKKLDSIVWDHRVRKIEVYEMPSKDMYEVLSPTVYRLKNNPKENPKRIEGGNLVKSELSLNTIKTVEVTEPHKTWLYNADDRAKVCNDRPQESIENNPKSILYIEITVTDKNGKTDHYLADRGLSFEAQEKRGNETDLKGPVDVIALPSIRLLTIEGRRNKNDDSNGTEPTKQEKNSHANNNKHSKKFRTAQAQVRAQKKAAKA